LHFTPKNCFLLKSAIKYAMENINNKKTSKEYVLPMFHKNKLPNDELQS